ncbi:hypothetical protein HELRODRAFT_168605 [Helobdella robusta]|uniref:Uncharacterized protein n=1 Tax=Helobdella robusta TaxID=6412 RepID=T1F0S5_HELRO|nr:hypothetical protein HELRODRAFT_168605 [Helobdella robusta]ESO09597.1 hypothetical protein HELRODRAFT_168605 [Helobdella robusta]
MSTMKNNYVILMNNDDISDSELESNVQYIESSFSDQALLHRRINPTSKDYYKFKHRKLKNSRIVKFFHRAKTKAKQNPRPQKISESLAIDLGLSIKSIEHEETVKCMVSSILFIMVIIVLIFVAILKNPEM